MKNKRTIITAIVAFIAIIVIIAVVELTSKKDTAMKTNTQTATNNASVESNSGDKVGFSAASGIYAEEFSLELTVPSGYDEIYYTTDGSDPATSDTAILYTGALQIKDRSGDENVVSAVTPNIYCGNFNEVTDDGEHFNCKIDAPSDDAVDKCTSIRAVAKNSDGTCSLESNAVYFIGTMEDHIQGYAESVAAYGMDLAVISISVDYDDLFDYETGIYVKGVNFDNNLAAYLLEESWMNGETARQIDGNYDQKGREWEREVGFTMLEVAEDGTTTEVLSHNCGIRIQGNYSRNDLQKGLRLYARTDYGAKNFEYALFGEDYLNDAGEVMNKFDSFVLRAGGNTAFSAKFNDTYWQSMVGDLDVDAKHSRPAILYINGEYFGLYVMEEDFSDDFFEDVHGVNKDNVVAYKGDAEQYAIGYKLDEGEIPDGEDVSYYFTDVLNFINENGTCESDEVYKEFCTMVDPNSCMDYFAIESWIDNKWDWPGKNWTMWKVVTPEGEEVDSSNPYNDGRWRFVVYDVEFGGFQGKSDAYTNTIKEDNYKTYGLLDMDTTNPSVRCFAFLMTNATFRQEFYARLNSLTDEYFEETAAKEQLQMFSDAYSPLYPQFFERYPGAGEVSDAEGSISNIYDFLTYRKDNVQDMIDYCEKILGD